MQSLAFLSLLACACAAPHYGPPPHHRHHHHHDNFSMDRFYGDSVFDTRQFWSEMSAEMAKFDQMMQEFMTHFPRSTSTAGIKDNQYVITIALNGFAEKDIVVKAREGLVMVQAVQKTEDGNGRSYLDVRNLPENVSPTGSWTYEQSVLKMVFPLKGSTTEAPSTTEAATEVSTKAPRDREEVESEEESTNMDADVGLERGDTEILTNEILQQNPAQAVEATTYAIDVRSNFDFVPVTYKK